MKVTATVTFSDEQRRLVARFLGQDGMATRHYCIAWAKSQVACSLAVLAVAEEQKAAKALRAAPTGSIQGVPLE